MSPTNEQLEMLDPDTATMVATLGAQPPLKTMTPSEARDLRRRARELAPARPLEELAGVAEERWPLEGRDLAVRIFRPAGATAPAPALVCFHGGGYVLGSLDDHEPLCRQLANRLGAVVVSVGYRLAPEHRFPAAVDDAYDAFRYASDHAAELGVDPDRIAIGGDSAGGGLAAAVCLRAAARGVAPPVAQLLVYPLVHCSLDAATFDEELALPPLTVDSLRWFFEHTFNERAETEEPEASPLLAPDLSAMPPAVIVAAHFDILRPQVEAYAARLREAGVDVELLVYPGVVHGFFGQAPLIARATTAVDEAARALRPLLGAAVAG